MRVITLTKKKSCTIFMNGIMFAYIMTSKIKDTFKLLQNSFPIKLMIFLYHARHAGDGTRIRHVCGLENGMADETERMRIAKYRTAPLTSWKMIIQGIGEV